jgi:hypothetical protein
MQDHSAERWLPIPGHDGYEVSDHGRVRSLDRAVLCKNGRLMRLRGKLLKPQARTGGHMWIQFGPEARSVHSLVLEAFVGPRPTDLVACHWDDVPSNNHLSNLRWGSLSDNMRDRIRNGKHSQSKRTHCPRSHELVAPNLVASAARDGRRSCLACTRAYSIVRNAKRKGVSLDFKPISDAYFADIMSGRAAPPRPRSRRAA